MLFIQKESGTQLKKVMKKPYKETKLKKNKVIREFSSKTSSSELEWHLDKEDRIIEVLENKGGWKIQLDNELPVLLEDTFFIPKETYHRVIKGDNQSNLIIKITKNPMIFLS